MYLRGIKLLNIQKIMELTLTRTTRRRGYTQGVLTDENGKHLADTLEPQ